MLLRFVVLNLLLAVAVVLQAAGSRNFDGIIPYFDPRLFILHQRVETTFKAMAEPQGYTKHTPMYFDIKGHPSTNPFASM